MTESSEHKMSLQPYDQNCIELNSVQHVTVTEANQYVTFFFALPATFV